MSALGLMLKVLWSPGQAFREIKEAGVGPWIPILVFVVFGITGTFLLTSRIDVGEALMREVLRSPQAGNMSNEQMEQMRQGFDNPGFVAFFYAIALFFSVMPVIVAGVYYLIFLVLGSRSGFIQFWAVTAFAFTPLLLNSIAGTAVMYTIPPSALELGQMNVLSLTIFMDPPARTGALYALAQALSLTTIWTLTLLIIGYGVLASKRINAVVRAVVVLIPWLVMVTLRVLPALLFG